MDGPGSDPDGAQAASSDPSAGSPPPTEPQPAGSHKGRRRVGAVQVAAAKERYVRLRDRVEATTPGQVRRRLRELDIMNHALILASLSLTLLVPALVTIAAVLPIGSSGGLAGALTRRLGLSAQSARDLRALFPTRQRVAGSTTALSAIATLFFAIGWPSELGRGYQAIWALPARGLRDLWRTVAWLASFFVVIAVMMAVGSVASGVAGTVVTSIVGLPVVFGWTWWGQHLLLGARVSWRALVPGTLATTLLLLGFSFAMKIYMPIAIVDNFRKYGPIGIVFALLSWLIGFSAVMLGGPLVGHTIHNRRRARTEAVSAAAVEPVQPSG